MASVPHISALSTGGGQIYTAFRQDRVWPGHTRDRKLDRGSDPDFPWVISSSPLINSRHPSSGNDLLDDLARSAGHRFLQQLLSARPDLSEPPMENAAMRMRLAFRSRSKAPKMHTPTFVESAVDDRL